MNDRQESLGYEPAAASRVKADLARLASIAQELEDDSLAAEARADEHRLGEGRFFVACVGQFKRGKSTLLNALVGRPVLPVGVVPVTSVITILRYGNPPGAIVRFEGGGEEPLALDQIASVIDERLNPRNRKQVVAVELTLPVPVLSNGLCLVDTPGIGSVFRENTDVTRRFVPQVDVALVVVGPDPPISGEELALIEEVSRDATEVMVVLNKADQVSRTDREEILKFTATALGQRLRRPIGRILEVSALERIDQNAPTRDWAVLEDTLQSLAAQRHTMVASAIQRSHERLARRVLAEIESQESALRRPLEETAARVTRLREVAGAAEHSLRELRFLLDSAEAELERPLEEARLEFIEIVRPELRRALERWVTEEGTHLSRSSLNAGAFDQARTFVETAVLEWMERLEPRVLSLYATAAERFTRLADDCISRISADLTGLGWEEVSAAPADPGYSRRHFQFTTLMHLTARGPMAWLIQQFAPAGAATRHLQHRVSNYLDHLLESNSHRVQNDFRDRTRETREALERRIRAAIRQALASAERAMTAAIAKRNMAEEELRERLAYFAALRMELKGE